MTKYFENCRSLDQLKKQYRLLQNTEMAEESRDIIEFLLTFEGITVVRRHQAPQGGTASGAVGIPA